jgi:1-acyl-sn-glycerol-3-phosphate acyltransferase
VHKNTKDKLRIVMQWSYFDSFSYDTKEKTSRRFLNWVLQDNWFYFLFQYGKIVLRTRKEALNNVFKTKQWADSSFEIFRLIEKTGGRFHITGMENIAKSIEPVVFISNHISTLETMVFPGIIAPHRDVTFVVKDSLVRHPVFGPVMRSREPIIVGRSEPRKDFETVMNEGMDLLSKGISIVIFPQSTRSNIFKADEFNSMGVKLAKKAGVKIVPVAIKTDFWGNGKIIKEIGPLDHNKPVMIKFGEPFPVTGNGKEENQRIIDYITENLIEWNGLVG